MNSRPTSPASRMVYKMTEAEKTDLMAMLGRIQSNVSEPYCKDARPRLATANGEKVVQTYFNQPQVSALQEEPQTLEPVYGNRWAVILPEEKVKKSNVINVAERFKEREACRPVTKADFPEVLHTYFDIIEPSKTEEAS